MLPLIAEPWHFAPRGVLPRTKTASLGAGNALPPSYLSIRQPLPVGECRLAQSVLYAGRDGMLGDRL